MNYLVTLLLSYWLSQSIEITWGCVKMQMYPDPGDSDSVGTGVGLGVCILTSTEDDSTWKTLSLGYNQCYQQRGCSESFRLNFYFGK